MPEEHGSPGGKFMLRASEFEIRHPTLLHLLIVGAGWATYLADREDVVWRLIRGSPSRRLLEHAVFAFATLLIGSGAVLCTRSRARMDLSGSRFFGEWMYAAGLASLLPLRGFTLLIVGESIRIIRMALSEKVHAQLSEGRSKEPWGEAVQRESVKWGIFLTMIFFTVSLVDRVADYGILASILAWGILSVSKKTIRAMIFCG
jgi:hypothetical protein